MARQSGLGKGLGALIPPEVAGKTKGDGPVLRDIPVGDIVPNPNQPRAHFDEESLADLSASIREVGVLQPVLVRQTGANSYELVAGERRWRAARRAGRYLGNAVLEIHDPAIRLDAANKDANLTNSWPRWGPLPDDDILWLATSSTRPKCVT